MARPEVRARVVGEARFKQGVHVFFRVDFLVHFVHMFFLVHVDCFVFLRGFLSPVHASWHVGIRMDSVCCRANRHSEGREAFLLGATVLERPPSLRGFLSPLVSPVEA